jgi:hypothetical protein
MECLSQGDSSANSSDPDDELGSAYINESGLTRILGRMTGYAAEVSASKPDRTITSGLPSIRELSSRNSNRITECDHFYLWCAIRLLTTNLTFSCKPLDVAGRT